jgi:hypothetical protein
MAGSLQQAGSARESHSQALRKRNARDMHLIANSRPALRQCVQRSPIETHPALEDVASRNPSHSGMDSVALSTGSEVAHDSTTIVQALERGLGTRRRDVRWECGLI